MDKYGKSVCKCGNGALDSVDSLADEVCDDNNFVDGDGCSSTCKVENSYFCTAVASSLSTCTY